MATILIVDDDKFTRNVLETIFTQDRAFRGNATVLTASDGQEGLDAFRQHRPEIVITDLLMPKIDGFGLCKSIRAEPGGDRVKLLVTSGVYRDAAVAQRLRAEYDASFYAKPYQVKQLTQAVARAIGTDYSGRTRAVTEVPAPIEARSGDLAEQRLPAILFELHDGQATGRITLQRGRTTKTIDLVLGHPVSATSNIREETLGHFLVARGVINGEQHRRGLEVASAEGTRLGAALIKGGALTSEQLVDLLRAQVQHRVVDALRWDEGTWEFEPGPESRSAGEPLDLEQVILQGLRDTAQIEHARRRLSPLRSSPLTLTGRGARLEQRLGRLLGGQLASVWSSGSSLKEMIEAGSDRTEIELAIDTLLEAGLLEVAAPSAVADAASSPVINFGASSDGLPSVEALSERASASAASGATGDEDEGGLYGMLFGDTSEPTRMGANPLLVADDDAVPESLTDPAESGVIDVAQIRLQAGNKGERGESDSARRQLLEEYLRVQGLDHYEVLLVDRGASPAEIAGAIAERRNKFSLEYFARFDLGRDYAKLEDLHRRYEQARDTLLDDDRRAAYDREIVGGDLGPSAPSLDAEIAYGAATKLLTDGDFRNAIRKLEKAIELAPGEPEYHAELGWARFVSGSRTAAAADQARPHLNQALRIDPDHPRAHEYKGAITATLGNDDVEAIFHLERALEGDPTRLEPIPALEQCWRRRGELRPLERQFRKLIHRVAARGRVDVEVALWVKLGEIYAELDDLESARVAYQSALRMAPNDATVRAAMTALGRASRDGESERLEMVREHWRRDPTNAGPGLEFLRVALQANRQDIAFAAASALVARGLANDEAETLYRRHRPRFVVRAQRQIDSELWTVLAHPDDDLETSAFFDLLAPAFQRVSPIRREDLEIDESTELPDEELPPGFARMREYVSHVLGVRSPDVHVRTEFGHEVHVGAIDPPVLIVGEETLAAPERLELAYRLGRAMTFLRPGRALGGSHPARMLKAGMLAALTAASPSTRVPDPTGFIEQLREEIEDLEEPVRAHLLQLAQFIAGRSANINLSRWARSLARTADRAGLLFCGDLPAAVRFMKDSGGSDSADELIDWALGADYAYLRTQMGLSIDV